MRIGVPKEVKILEHRVGILPAGVRELVNDGHAVFVESNAGVGVGVSDDDYRTAGALVLGTAKEVFEAAQLIVKVKEPQPREWIAERLIWVLMQRQPLSSTVNTKCCRRGSATATILPVTLRTWQVTY